MTKKKKTNKKTTGKQPINKYTTRKQPVKKQPSRVPGEMIQLFIQKHSVLILFSLMLLIILFVFNDYIFQRSLYLFQDIGSDSLNAYYTRFVHFARYLYSEGIPRWSFSQGMGQNLYPGHMGDPFHVIFYIIGAKNVAQAIIYVEISKFLLAGLFTYLYLRIINISKYVSIVGGLIMAFLGYIILGSSGWYGHSTNVLLGVFLLFSFEMYYKKQKWYFLPVAIFLLAANPFRLFLFSIFLITYIIMRVILEKGFNYKLIGRILLFTGIFSLIGLLISAVFIYGDLYKMMNSPRVSGEVGYQDKLSDTPVFSLAPSIHYITVIMRLFSNDLLGTGSNYKGWFNYLEAPVFYSSILTLILIPQLFVNVDKRKKIVLGAFLLLWIIPVIFPFFRYALNAFMGDYYKHGMSTFIPLVLLILGMYSFSYIHKNNRINLTVLIITILVLLALLYYPYFNSDEFPRTFRPINKDLRNTIRNFIMLYGILLFSLMFTKTRNYAYGILLIVLCFELGTQANNTVNKRDTLSRNEFKSKIGYNDYSSNAINYIKKQDTSFFRISRNYLSNYTEHISLNNAQAQDYFGTPSYYSFNQLNYIRFLKAMNIIKPGEEGQTRWSKGFLDRPLLQVFGSIKYRLEKGETKGVYKFIYDSIAQFNDVKVLKNNYFLPFGFTYDQYIPYNQYDTIKNNTVKEVLMLKSCVLESETYPEQRDNLEKGNIPDPNYTLIMLDKDIQERKSPHFQMTKFSENEIKGNIDLEKYK
ncbi:MAG: YfhO family protein, partial [bacterium]